MTRRILLIFLFLNLSFCAFAQMKTWWFFGYERTGKEGIVADITALKDAGFSGVVYYDQNHAADARANGAGAGIRCMRHTPHTHPASAELRCRKGVCNQQEQSKVGELQTGLAGDKQVNEGAS